MSPLPFLQDLASRRPLFHSEADFQHALAWEFQQQLTTARIRLEMPVQSVHGRGALDIFVHDNPENIGFELKYFKSALIHEHEGETFRLPTTSANDIARYDVCKDIRRLEHLTATGQIDRGYVIVLTNDPQYWRGSKKLDSIDAAFKLTEGLTLSGKLAWGARAGAGTTKGREEALRLAGNYSLSWQDYSNLDARNGEFRVLIIPVTGGFGGDLTSESFSITPAVNAPQRATRQEGRNALSQFFRALSDSEITLSFDEIEEIFGVLPPSALNHAAWWSSVASHRDAVWELEGFFASPRLGDRKVRFRRR